MDINKKIFELRNLMKSKSLDYYLIPHEDENLLEYTPTNKERLKWISGFSGSAGSMLVGLKSLNLFIDGRYTIQSKLEMEGINCSINNISSLNMLNFLKKIKSNGITLGLDINTISVSTYNSLKEVCNSNNIKIKGLDKNLIDKIWKRNLDLQKTSKIFFLDRRYTGIDLNEKIKKIIAHLKENKADYCYIQNSESIAWLLNLRGRDLNFTPITFCNGLISKDLIYLFFENEKIPKEIKKKLGNKVKIYNKNELGKALKASKKVNPRIIVDKEYTSVSNLKILCSYTKNIIFKKDVIQTLKSIKNIQEVKCIKKAHILDGKALCKFLYWFKNKKDPFTELDVVNKIDTLRMENEGYISRSFPTIAGSGPNGAIIHYQPTKKSNRTLKKNDVLLLDSGAQYIFGTTDVTRTVSKGKMSQNAIFDYTLVLKGHVNVNLSKFPLGVSGNYLDYLARQFLWINGKDYAHSTGHGIGFCLNVHEGPFSISTRSSDMITHGMVFSNEPGYYKKNCYGIRIENVVTAKNIILNKKNFIKIENFTLAPYELDLIDKSILTVEEKNWINNYHKDVIKKISPFLLEKERVWLKKACKEIL